jgi:hypothetical protein
MNIDRPILFVAGLVIGGFIGWALGIRSATKGPWT